MLITTAVCCFMFYIVHRHRKIQKEKIMSLVSFALKDAINDTRVTRKCLEKTLDIIEKSP